MSLQMCCISLFFYINLACIYSTGQGRQLYSIDIISWTESCAVFDSTSMSYIYINSSNVYASALLKAGLPTFRLWSEISDYFLYCRLSQNFLYMLKTMNFSHSIANQPSSTLEFQYFYLQRK